MSASITPEPSTKRLSFRLMRPFTVPWITRSSSPEISPSMTIELPITVCAPLRGEGTFSIPAMCVRPPELHRERAAARVRPGQDRRAVRVTSTSHLLAAGVRRYRARPYHSLRGRFSRRGAATSGQPGDRLADGLRSTHLVEELVSEPLVHVDRLVARARRVDEGARG